MVLELLHDALQAFLEVAPITRAREQGPHVEREDRGVRQNLGHLLLVDLAREAFSDGGLAHARIADQQRVVLLAPAENLDRAHDLGFPADQRIDLALLGLLVEVHAISRQRLLALFDDALAFLFVGAAHGARLRRTGTLWQPVRDEVHRVVARHVLLLQEVRGVALPLREQRDEHVGARHFPAAR